MTHLTLPARCTLKPELRSTLRRALFAALLGTTTLSALAQTPADDARRTADRARIGARSEEHTSELQSP